MTPRVGRPKGSMGYRPGGLEAAVETWLFRHEKGFVSEISEAVGSHPDSVRNALKRLGATSDGATRATWTLPKG